MNINYSGKIPYACVKKIYRMLTMTAVFSLIRERFLVDLVLILHPREMTVI